MVQYTVRSLAGATFLMCAALAAAAPAFALQLRVEARARQELEEMLTRIEKHFRVRLAAC